MENLTLSWKRSKSFNIKIKNPYYNFDLKKSLRLIIVVLVMFYKMLVIVFNIEFYSEYGTGSQKPSLSICAHF